MDYALEAFCFGATLALALFANLTRVASFGMGFEPARTALPIRQC